MTCDFYFLPVTKIFPGSEKFSGSERVMEVQTLTWKGIMDLNSSFMTEILLLAEQSEQISWMELRKVGELSLFYQGKLKIRQKIGTQENDEFKIY